MGGIDIIQMTGSNFGPVAKDVIVKYGKYLSFNHTCATVEGFHQSLVRCVTASGTGKVHAFTVDVSGQVAGGSDRFDYPAPIFTSGSLRILGQKCAGPTKCYNVQKDGQGRVRAIARSTIEGTVVEIANQFAHLFLGSEPGQFPGWSWLVSSSWCHSPFHAPYSGVEIECC